MRQKTINKKVVFSGKGLHSGKPSQATCLPAPADHGIIFLHNNKRIPALAKNISQTNRGTTLEKIAVTEHLLAAVFALGIDNLLIEVAGNEIPAMDGSALPFVEGIVSAGVVDLVAEKNYYSVKQAVKVEEGKSSIELSPYNGFKVDFMVDFPSVGEQKFSFELTKKSFLEDIAPARTFGYLEEVESLKKQGLGLGASLENALVLNKNGYVNKPRFVNELVRHKILDLLGDLCLLGQPISGAVKAKQSGHKLNLALVRRLLTK